MIEFEENLSRPVAASGGGFWKCWEFSFNGKFCLEVKMTKFFFIFIQARFEQ